MWIVPGLHVQRVEVQGVQVQMPQRLRAIRSAVVWASGRFGQLLLLSHFARRITHPSPDVRLVARSLHQLAERRGVSRRFPRFSSGRDGARQRPRRPDPLDRRPPHPRLPRVFVQHVQQLSVDAELAAGHRGHFQPHSPELGVDLQRQD